MIKYDFINSSSDGLKIELAYTIPKEEIKGIVQFHMGWQNTKKDILILWNIFQTMDMFV